MDAMNFALSSNNKDQLRDLCNYLHQEEIIAMNYLNGSTLGDNVVTSHQVDHMLSALIPAEAEPKAFGSKYGR